MLHFITSSFRRTTIAIASTAALAVFAAPARAEIQPTFNADEIGSAIASDQSLVTGASFVKIPAGYKAAADYPHISPAAVSDTPLASFATDGPSYGILSTGDPRLADDANTKPDSGVNAGGGHFQGAQNYDVTVLRVDVNVPAKTNCLSFDYRFLSEEFSEYVGGNYNDTFIAQLDRYDWDAAQQAVVAPGNFATTGEPIGIDSAGAYQVNADQAAGTTYDAASKLITASTPVTPGAHSVYLSIFDQGDVRYDSAAFVDNLKTTHEDTGLCASPDDQSFKPETAAPESPKSVEPKPAQASPVPLPATPSSVPSSAIRRVPARSKSRKLKSFSGRAWGGNGIARVEVALVKVKGGPATSKASSLKWRSVSGTKSWNFSLGRSLPKGKYTLYSRATDGNGAAEQNFSAANRVTFTVY